MFRRRRRLLAAPSPPPAVLRRAFRSEAALEAIRSHSHSHSPPPKTASSSSSDADADAGQAAGPASLALYNYPTFAGAYAALAARLFHQRVGRRLLVLPFSSVVPFRAEDFKDAGFQTCYLLDFIGPKKFAFELARFVPSVIAFDHRQSTLARIPKLGQCPSNVELHIDISKGSAQSVFDYFSKELAGRKSDSRTCENLLDQEDVKRVSNVLEYIEDADLRRYQLPNTKEFQTALRDERAKLNCVTNPHVFGQLLQLDVGDLLTRQKSQAHDRLQAAGEFIQKPFRIQLGRGSYGECLAIRADGHTELSHEIGLELSLRSAAAGLRPIGAVVFMQRGVLKVCLRTNDSTVNTSEIAKAIRADGHTKLSHEIGLELSLRSAAAGLRPIGAVVFMQRGVLKVCLRTNDSTVNTSEIAKAYGGGGKKRSSSFTLRMDEFNIWTSVNS